MLPVIKVQCFNYRETEEAVMHAKTSIARKTTVSARNIKYNVEKADCGDMANSNFAHQINHITCLISNKDTFIQSLIHQNEKVLSIVLHTGQSRDITKDNCFCAKQVLKVVRTLNLRYFYVTVTCFKKKASYESKP